MRCSQVQRLSTEYIDGDLDADRSSAVRGHLRGCDDCSALFDQEVAVRAVARDLDDQVDPPDELWQRICDEVAAAEVRDAERGRIALAWRRVRSALEPYRLHLATAVVAAVVLSALAVKDQRAAVVAGVEIPSESQLQITEVAPTLIASATNGPLTHTEQVVAEVEHADERYETAIAELRQLAASERARWSAAVARKYDTAIAQFDTALAETRRDLDRRIPRDPRMRDPLYEMYREHIAFLEDAVWGTL